MAPLLIDFSLAYAYAFERFTAVAISPDSIPDHLSISRCVVVLAARCMVWLAR